MLIISLLLLVVSIFADDPYNCTRTQTINPPANISTPVIYPATWNPSKGAPQYASGQSCSWIVNVPKGMYALLQIKATTNESTTLQVNDSTGYVTIIQLADMEPFFLMDPSFRIDLHANKIGTFGMRIRWSIVQNASSTAWRTRQRSSPQTMFGSDFDNVTTIEADTRVNLLTLSPTRFSGDSSRLLRNTQVYDGNSIEAKHIGNLYQIHKNGARFVSTGKYLTLRSLLPGYYAVGNGVIVQDYEDVKPFHSYKAINCIMEAPCNVLLDATNGTAAAIRYSDEVIYMRNIKMTETNKISVYTDFVTDAHKLTDYLSTNINTTIPQKLNGQYTTFVLDKDHAIVSLTSDGTNWTSGFGGRRGFMTSPNYAINSNNQNFEDKIYSTSSKSSKISFYIDKASIPYGVTTISILRDRNTVFNATYSLENLPEDSTISAIGDTLSVQYQLNPTVYSKGIYISFGFDENGSAGMVFSILLIAIVSIFI
ncbi:hypothetical protein GCK72_015684 [Caenorhabditis remanei]|uniref:Uncharacterized protein n=1 Tax=Caenorhabditis remanei TaxID=31234 RepID=A0A6A5GXV6_CAERE|nr:hypothetical protein GCK72_015684 [Caenorhabditis remanei]KAF1759223.1 hypothetical protein GCK72_015684 [Caenorhabditis remanei]